MTNHQTVSFAVEDMTCGHCARAITSAVEAAAPGAIVSVDLAIHRVTVSGAADRSAIAEAIAAEGYTPIALDAA
ncbi:copper chaperone [Rhizobium subbaraonis]|uniref:Copper chaperone n=1 Tax=Rhizobium subbaraonis TaxID=908946 RepID=A0A285U382_9HYPH|nr:heavy-metal-associated domain-containing protein [Rhizobium subbaraonis]SOC36147.1 copper chaperone [Rhizobium subbaraonis]